jgi:excisionase family DNA binding protein
MAAQTRRMTLTVGEVADELQVSESTVWKLIRTGELPSVKVSGLRRVTRDAFERYLTADEAS